MSNQLSLEAVLRDLMQRRIFCGISTKAPDHVLVWLVFNGRLVEGTEHSLPIGADVPDQIARWLKDAADRLCDPARTAPG